MICNFLNVPFGCPADGVAPPYTPFLQLLANMHQPASDEKRARYGNMAQHALRMLSGAQEQERDEEIVSQAS